MHTLLTRTGTGLLGLGILSLSLLNGASASAASVPFTDGSAVASIGLCDAHGNPITSGSMDTHPFVAAAASSAATPTGYAPDNKSKATLYAFQPRQGVEPGEWSGFQLTAGSVFADSAHPLVAGTNLDPSLREYTSAYAPRWNGLIQLRIYYTATNKVVSRRTYPAAVLRVTGNIWTMLQGATNLHCDLTKVVSSERLNLPVTDFDPKNPAVTHPPAPAGANSPVTDSNASTSPSAGSNPAGSASPTAPATASASPLGSASGAMTVPAVSNASARSGGSGPNPVWWVLGVVVVAGATGAAMWRRLRTR